MTVVSKFFEDTLDRYERMGYTKLKLSQVIVGASICAYVAKLSYPIIKNQYNNLYGKNNCKHNNKKTNYSKLNGKLTNGQVKRRNNNNNSNKKKCHNKENNDCTGNHLLNGTTDSSSSSSSSSNCSNCSSEEDNGNNEQEIISVEKQIETAEKLLAKAKEKPNNIGLNLEFLLQLKKLFHIMIPRPMCREIGLLTVHTICLISRTFLSIYVASMEGAIVKFIVQKDVKNFLIMLLKWFGIAIPATFVNSMIRYLECRLALSFRTRLVNHSYKLYFKNQTYYRVSNLDGRIENADHRLTEDISTFASSIAHLYSSLTKPCFDLMLIGYALMRSSQKMKANIVLGPLLSFVVIGTTGHILRMVSPKFGQLVSEEANRYGYLRHIHSRIITNAEEIAFYGGHNVELSQLREAYGRLSNQMNSIFTQKLWFVMLEQFFMKYVWSGTGMIMIAMPVLTASHKELSDVESGISDRTQYLTTARNLLISAADAIERLMSSYKEIVSLAGYTHRVAGMLEIFDEASCGIYDKTRVVSAEEERNNAGILEFYNGRPVANGKIIYMTDNDLGMCSISLKSVPVVTPNYDIVVPSLTLIIEPGMHVLITGPNGCGKSSLFRILSGLWPIYGGELSIPKPINGKPCMFYIPQRPYLSIGSLRDQIIYPDTVNDMNKKNITEQHLWEIMRMVSLDHIVTRDKFDVVRDWKDILSGGEKQRMAIGRLFYHKPQYALLDECTSAVSIDVESSIYESAKNAGITLLTITHRPTLWKFHTHILEFDGQGGWNFQPLEKDSHQKSPYKPPSITITNTSAVETSTLKSS